MFLPCLCKHNIFKYLPNIHRIKQKLILNPLQNGDYTIENIEAYGTIGFGIVTDDRQDLAANKNGVYNIQTFFNGNKYFELDFKRFSFDETKHINRLIDYEHYRTKKQRVQKLYNDNNPLSIIKTDPHNGHLPVEDSTYSVFKIKVTDFKNNQSWITLNIKGSKNDSLEIVKDKVTPYFIKANQTTNLKESNITVDIFQNTFYDDFYLDFNVSNDTLILHKDIIPTKKPIIISFLCIKIPRI